MDITKKISTWEFGSTDVIIKQKIGTNYYNIYLSKIKTHTIGLGICFSSNWGHGVENQRKALGQRLTWRDAVYEMGFQFLTYQLSIKLCTQRSEVNNEAA